MTVNDGKCAYCNKNYEKECDEDFAKDLQAHINSVMEI